MYRKGPIEAGKVTKQEQGHEVGTGPFMATGTDDMKAHGLMNNIFLLVHLFYVTRTSYECTCDACCISLSYHLEQLFPFPHALQMSQSCIHNNDGQAVMACSLKCQLSPLPNPGGRDS